ncbi:MAG: ATP-binding protein [Rhizobacter sp.]
MQLAAFIAANIEPILRDWVAFARTRIPVAGGMTELALRNDAAGILTEIAHDMLRPQGEDQQLARSQGMAVRDPELAETPSRSHAMQRARSGFEVNQMVSEYRALRATVLRLWSAAATDVTVHDLQDVTRFNEAVDQALAESLKFFVAEVDRARNLVLGVLGHDLRTPLGVVVNCAQHQLRVRPDDTRDADMILRSAARMKSLVDEVLSYTRKRLGTGLVIHATPVHLARFSRDIVDEILAVTPPGRAIDLTSTGNLEGVWDARRLHQLLSNLIGNALKYGAPDKAIRVMLDGTADDEVVLAVHNFGPPIPGEILPDVFEPLVRGAAEGVTSQTSGASMGLGLYIAREIASAHCGSIGVTSSAEEGTRFELRMPRACA